MPLIFDVTDLKLVATAVPADNATSTTLEDTGFGASKIAEMNNYTEMECCVAFKDAGTGAKSVVFTVYSGGPDELDDGAWTNWLTAYTETVDLGTAAYDGIVSIKLDQKKFARKYGAFKAVVTHVDPGAGEDVHLAAFMVLHGDHRV